MPSYYQNQNFLNVCYATDVSIENHYKNILFPEDEDYSRIIFSSNSHALYKRAKGSNISNLNMPFMNYKLVEFNFGVEDWFHNRLVSQGIFIDELGYKIRAGAIRLEYECTFWCNRDDEMKYIASELRWDSDNQTLLKTAIDVNGTTIYIPSHLGYLGLKVDPEYNEQDWLEKNKIHSITMDFEIHTWILKSNTNVSIPKEIIFKFLTAHDLIDGNEALQDLEYFHMFQSYFGEGTIEASGEGNFYLEE